MYKKLAVVLFFSLLTPVSAIACPRPLVIKGQPVEEATAELQPYCESLEKHLCNQSRFTKLLRRLFFELREGEAVACFFRVDEFGDVFGEKVIVCNHSQVSKPYVRSAFCSAGKFPKPPNLWPKQVGMVASFVREDGLIQFGLAQAPADNVRVGKFTGLSETILEHYLWTPAQRKTREKMPFENVSSTRARLE